jgi:hypothetical protein
VTLNNASGAGFFSNKAYSWQVVALSLVTQHIRNHIFLARVVMHF